MQTDFSNTPEAQEAQQLVAQMEADAGSFRITTAAEYQAGGQALTKIKSAQKRLEALRTAITGPLNASLKAANDLFRAPAAKLETAERTIKAEITRFGNELERKRQEEQRKADEEAARKRAAQEAAERKSRDEADQKRREAEAAAAAGDAATAAKLQQQADRREEKADVAAQSAAMIVAPIIQREPPRVAGITTHTVWTYRITDPSKINAAFMMPDEQKIRAQVRALKGDAAAIIGPGVQVYPDTQVAAGAA